MKDRSFLVSVVYKKHLYEVAVKVSSEWWHTYDNEFTMTPEDKRLFKSVMQDDQLRRFGQVVGARPIFDVAISHETQHAIESAMDSRLRYKERELKLVKATGEGV